MILSRLKKKMTPAGRGSVLVIATLLLSSGTVRILTNASEAFAQESQLPTTLLPSAAKTSKETKAQDSEPDQQQLLSDKVATRADIANLVKALQDREAQVLERERQLQVRLRALEIADAEIELRLVTLQETEEALRQTLSLATEASEKDLIKLTSVYESMKPKDAATLFEQMEPNFSAGFLARMRPDIAAEVMSGLSPEVAYSISVILAGRNANVPKS